MEELIRLDRVCKDYVMEGEIVHAVVDVSLTIDTNEFVAFLGSSGSGKSTMMHILGCLDPPSSGSYLLSGRNVANLAERELALVRNRQIGFVFQSFNLLPRLTALQNIMQPLTYRSMGKAERLEQAQSALDRVGLSNRAGHTPSQLSGGQRQRVAIARALCTAPSLILADEPTGNLDSRTSSDILELFEELHRDGQTVVLVTHDPEVARRCGRQITLLDGAVQSDTAAAEKVA